MPTKALVSKKKKRSTHALGLPLFTLAPRFILPLLTRLTCHAYSPPPPPNGLLPCCTPGRTGSCWKYDGWIGRRAFTDCGSALCCQGLLSLLRSRRQGFLSCLHSFKLTGFAGNMLDRMVGWGLRSAYMPLPPFRHAVTDEFSWFGALENQLSSQFHK